MYTLLFAAHSREVKAAVPWYGQLRPAKTPGVRTVGPFDIAAKINCPSWVCMAEEDLDIPVADVKEMEACPEGGRQDRRVRHLSRRAPCLFRRLPAQLSGRGGQGRVAPLRRVVQQIPQTVNAGRGGERFTI